MIDKNITAVEWIQLLIDKGPELRKAGILQLSLEGCVLSPYQEDFQMEKDTPRKEDVDPFEDPFLYGLPPGSKVPSYSKVKTDE